MHKHKKRNLSVVVLTCLLGATSAQAQVSFGPDVFVKGATIEVLRPGPDLQVIIDLITDEAADNPYLIKLGPRKYSMVTGSGGTNNYGVYASGNASVLKIYSSVLEGSTAALRFGSNTGERIANSVIIGGFENSPGGVNCLGLYRSDVPSLSVVQC